MQEEEEAYTQRENSTRYVCNYTIQEHTEIAQVQKDITQETEFKTEARNDPFWLLALQAVWLGGSIQRVFDLLQV